MWTEIGSGATILTLIGVIFRMQQTKINKAVSIKTCEEIRTGCENGRGTYRNEVCRKLDELKRLFGDADTKREAAKDEYLKQQIDIADRLARIETKVENLRATYK